MLHVLYYNWWSCSLLLSCSNVSSRWITSLEQAREGRINVEIIRIIILMNSYSVSSYIWNMIVGESVFKWWWTWEHEMMTIFQYHISMSLPRPVTIIVCSVDITKWLQSPRNAPGTVIENVKNFSDLCMMFFQAINR